MFFYADSEDPSSEDYSPPGQDYPEATPIMFQIFNGAKYGFEGSWDRWGYWFSAYAPIVDEQTGAVVALVGMDLPGKEYLIQIMSYALLPLLLMGIILSLIYLAEYVRNRELLYIDQRSEFLSIASHEIRGPLSGIRWAAQALLTNSANSLDDYSRKVINLVHDNCVHVIQQVNNLLNVTSFERGSGIQLKKESFPLLPFIQQIADGLKLFGEARNVTVEIDPSVSSSIKIFADPSQLEHVFANLISNAIKYTDRFTAVTISYKHEEGLDCISVTDKGEGIPEEEQKHVFEGYHRTQKARASSAYGTGLGLYLAQKIANLHGGYITLKSKMKEGTTFTVCLNSEKKPEKK